MKVVAITRWGFRPWGTFGELAVDGEVIGAVLELPWQDNEQDVSCIPAGKYKLKRGDFKGRYANYEVAKVPGRTAIELHRGNTLEDTKGCPLIGRTLVINSEARAVYLSDSAYAFEQFMAAMAGARTAELEIVNVVW